MAESMKDKVKGIFKEAMGKAGGDADAEKAGQQQQKRAQSRDEADELEQEAASKRQEAAGHAGQQAKREN